MTNKDDASIKLANHIKDYLRNNQLNPSLSSISYEILALHLIDSINKSANLQRLVNKPLRPNASLAYCDPKSAAFDPIKAVLALRHSNYDDACWLSFLMTYTDDSEQTNWAFIKQLYKGKNLGLDTSLTWDIVNQQQTSNTLLFDKLVSTVTQSHPKPKFGHHRAYESLAHLPIVFSSYIHFINEQGGHRALFKPDFDSDSVNSKNDIDSKNSIDNKSADSSLIDKTEHFKSLYPLIRQNIYRFGRLSTFEFLCWLGKTGLASVAPDSCYIAEASGPKRGAKLLFGMLSNTQLDIHAIDLAQYLDIGYQELEEALCHWQKSPNIYLQCN